MAVQEQVPVEVAELLRRASIGVVEWGAATRRGAVFIDGDVLSLHAGRGVVVLVVETRRGSVVKYVIRYDAEGITDVYVTVPVEPPRW